MDDVTIHAVGNLEESIYVRPMQVVFTQKVSGLTFLLFL